MNYNGLTINALVLSLCMVTSSPNASKAQAYVGQAVGAQKGGAYVPQASPDLRRPKVRRTTPKNNMAVAARDPKPLPTSGQAFPTVGAGSSAIIKHSVDDSAWPSVGKGAVRSE